MVNKCSVKGCFTNYDGHDKGTVFSLPDDANQRKKWILFANRDSSIKNIFICYKHFDPKFIVNTPKRVKLLNNLKPVPQIIPTSQELVNLPPAAVMETIKPGRKPPTMRNFREDEIDKFKELDDIKSLDDLNEKKSEDTWT